MHLRSSVLVQISLAQWLRRSRRSVAALLLAALAFDCGEAMIQPEGPAQIGMAIGAGNLASAGEPDAYVQVADDAAPRLVMVDLKDGGAPGTRGEVTPSLCACLGALSLSVPVDLAVIDRATAPSSPTTADDTLPPPPALERPLRPPAILVG